jgi:uncharacterized protein (DUF427 family)
LRLRLVNPVGGKSSGTVLATRSSLTGSHRRRYPVAYFPETDVLRADVDESALTAVAHQTFCPYNGLCSYYDIGDARQAAWSCREAYPEVGRISDFVSFDPDPVSVQIDDTQLRLEPGQTVIPHGPDRDLTVAEALPRKTAMRSMRRPRCLAYYR